MNLKLPALQFSVNWDSDVSTLREYVSKVGKTLTLSVSTLFKCHFECQCSRTHNVTVIIDLYVYFIRKTSSKQKNMELQT